MAKKSPLPPPEPDEPIPPPAHLSARAQDLWAEVSPRCRAPGRLALLGQALEALDLADVARRMVAHDGHLTTTPGSGATHLNPMVKVELESRRQFASLWHQLGLSF